MFQSLIGRLQTAFEMFRKGLQAMFQSLIGRLQTVTALKKMGKYASFQSLIGRLQTALRDSGTHASPGVSIPHR